ncbi:MAG: acetate kinase [Trueperaceae bacterium]|nr:acetate kinase [Trueperaceae bacterium]
MPESVLVVNAGSSSLKVKLLPQGSWMRVERVGGASTAVSDRGELTPGPLPDQSSAFAFALAELTQGSEAEPPTVVGHRVVHGGTLFTQPTLIDDEVERELQALSPLAPLHNPANLEALRAARQQLPNAVHVAVFDTAFHATMPPHAYLYGLPLAYAAERGLRRYGFHGTSHDYVTREAAAFLGRDRAELRIVSLHLGNGASAAAVDHGVSVDTSMGYTPLEGLLMGSRSGDIDPGLVLHLLRTGMTVEQVDHLLNRGSGLLGMSGVSNDMRDVRAAADEGEPGAVAALEVFTYRLKKTIGSYAAAMGGIDALVFTGGIGENDPRTRGAATHGLGFMGIELDQRANAAGHTLISKPGAPVSVLVVRTDEEVLIAEQAAAVAADLARRPAADTQASGRT